MNDEDNFDEKEFRKAQVTMLKALASALPKNGDNNEQFAFSMTLLQFLFISILEHPRFSLEKKLLTIDKMSEEIKKMLKK